MRHFNHLFLLLILFFSLLTYTKSVAQIVISVPTIGQEATSIWRTINDIEFLEGQGYVVHLPESEVLDALILKSKSKAFGNSDFAQIYAELESNLYQNSTYEAALKKVKEEEGKINALIKKIRSVSKDWNWDFKHFDSYPIVFTLYGTGGSYDPDSGVVTLFTNRDGKFMNYESPMNTIMHEIVHMGIEESIVQKYKLPHGVKERLVDTITYLLFKDELPDYKIQPMGDKEIDAYIQSQEDVRELETKIVQYLESK